MLMAAAITSARPTAMRLTDVELYAWIAQAEPGARLEYHRGFLGVDITPVISLLPEPDRARLADLAAAALGAFEKGLVHLVQARLGTDRFAYIAITRPKPRAAQASLSRLLLAERKAA